MFEYFNGQFICSMCCNCCVGYGGGNIDFFDIKKMSNYFNISKKKFISKYVMFSNEKLTLSQKKSGTCIFLSKNKGCLVHEIKPKMCYIWPFLASILIDIKNWKDMSSYCPGIKDKFDTNEIRECILNFIKANPIFFV